MGAAYHTIHHTTYKHNYGHYFIYMDKLFGRCGELALGLWFHSSMPIDNLKSCQGQTVLVLVPASDWVVLCVHAAS